MPLGINSKNDAASITPAAKASMLNIKRLKGTFITPINEPIIGPIIAIYCNNYNINKGFISRLFVFLASFFGFYATFLFFILFSKISLTF